MTLDGHMSNAITTDRVVEFGFKRALPLFYTYSLIQIGTPEKLISDVIVNR